MSGNRLQRFVGTRFRRIITGDPQGIPPWLDAISSGSDGGLYSPGDAPWVVHANFATLIGGIRALLLQTLHPGSLAGVSQHSRYESDALGRLAGTTKWLTITTFGSTDAIEVEAARVNGMHERVRGSYKNAAGSAVRYRASDTDLLLWVHCAFTDSFLTAHRMYADTAIPGGDDRYVRQWAASVVPLGLNDVPQSAVELRSYIESLRTSGVLKVDETTLRVVAFLRRPPLSLTARLAYAFLFAAAVVSLPKELRTMLKLPRYPVWLVRPLGRGFLRFLRVAVGSESPIEAAALVRRHRLGIPD